MVQTWQSDPALLRAVPQFISVGGLLKATPAEEGRDRFLYLEASNEDEDSQGDRILRKPLAASAPYYLRHGNIDISHITILQGKSGVRNFHEYEIGRPVDVRFDSGSTFVKAQLYTGTSPMAHNADMVWGGLVRQHPPQRWYPSIGGKVLSKSVKVDVSGERRAVVDKVLWTNTALDPHPINRTVGGATVLPPAVFMKSLNGFLMARNAQEASVIFDEGQCIEESCNYAADMQWPGAYETYRDELAEAIRAGDCGQDPTVADLVAFVRTNNGWAPDDAAQFVERFMRDVRAGLNA